MHLKLNLTVIAGMLVALAVVSVASGTSAGPLDPTAGPTNTNAYTLDQLWNRLSYGAAGTPSTFTEPSSGPGTSTMHTLDDIMALAPAVDDTNGASAAEVVSGKTFWGLTTGGWGVKTGTAALGSDVSGANGSLIVCDSEWVLCREDSHSPGHGSDGGEHPGGGEHLRGGRQLHPGERECGRRGRFCSARRFPMRARRGSPGACRTAAP